MSTALRVGPPPRPIDEMLAAIDIEIAAVQEKSRAQFIAVRRGVRVAQAGPGATYRFACDPRVHLRDDERVVGRFGEQRVDGCVVACAGGRVTVALAGDLGQRLPTGKLVIDRTFLWKALKDRLRAIAIGHGGANTRAVDALTGASPLRSGRRAPVDPSTATRGLNPEQVSALELALGSGTSLIFGPPGTGKTHLLERVVADGFYAAGESTLYTGPTNKAVDLGLRRIIDRLRRLGKLDAALDAGAIVRVGPISDPQLEADFGHRIGLEALVSAREERLAARMSRLVEVRHALLECVAADEAPDGARAAAARSRKLEQLDHRIGMLEQRIKSARRTILGRALIVATTAHRAMLPEQVERTFDAVVLDEAAATALPVACCAVARASRHVVCAGDPYQLPAVHESSHPVVESWIGRDVFHASGALHSLQQQGSAAGLACLTTQHRFDAPLAALANHVTYRETPLVTHAGLMHRQPSPSPWGTASIMLLDTSALQPFVRKRRSGGSRCNPVHAAVVRWLVTELEQSGRIPGRPDDPDAVAVLTPYRAQRDLVRGRLPAALLSRGLTVDTVHTYQGDEAGTVILDMVDARGLPVTPFLRSSDRSSTGSRLFNVAATRPRRRLIAVCPLRFALRSASRGPVREFVDYLQKHATRIHLPLDLAHKALAFVHEWEQGSGR
jgi:hypothetical protein